MKNFQQLWQDAEWRARVNEWARDALEKQNMRVVGELQETQVRPWSIVLHTLTDRGKIYFKAPPPVLAHELALTEKLAQWFPSQIPQVVAVERTECWWLARDGGESIRANLKATRDLGEWCAALRLYAKMQMKLAGRVDEMLALGVPDRRPRTLPAQFAALLQDTPMLRIDLPKGISREEYARLGEMASPLAEWCGQLEESKIPNSLHHGDLNSSNVLKHEGQFVFVDWGDASVAHPFSSLRTALVSAEIVLDLPDNDAGTMPLRKAYLEAWTDYDSLENVRAEFRLAHRLSSLVSALSWYRDLVPLSEAERAPYEHAVPSLLQEFLSAEFDKYPFV